MEDFFDIQILIDAFKVMSIIQVLAVGVVRFLSASFLFFGIVAIGIEQDEATHSRIFKRGYGWGLSMIIVGIFFAVFEWTIVAFSQLYSPDADPLMLLSFDVNSLSDLNSLDLFSVWIAAYLSLVAFLFIAGGFLAVIKASHRMEKGASVVAKYWIAGIALLYMSHSIRESTGF